MMRLWLLGMLPLIGACSLLPPALRGDTRPEWIRRGSGFFEGMRGKALYGVGVASDISDLSLRREAAEAAARADLARAFRSQVSTLLRSYAASTGNARAEESERHTERTIQVSAEAELVHVPVIDRYSEGGGRVEYALVVMDAQAFQDQVGRMGTLREEERRRIREEAERAFGRGTR